VCHQIQPGNAQGTASHADDARDPLIVQAGGLDDLADQVADNGDPCYACNAKIHVVIPPIIFNYVLSSLECRVRIQPFYLRARMSVRSGYCAPAPVFQAAPAGNWSAGNWLPRQAQNRST